MSQSSDGAAGQRKDAGVRVGAGGGGGGDGGGDDVKCAGLGLQRAMRAAVGGERWETGQPLGEGSSGWLIDSGPTKTAPTVV